MADKKGIKQFLELCDSLEEIGKTVAQVMEDGKVNLDDLPAAIGVLSKMNSIIVGFKGITEIDDELKELTEAEAIEVVKKLYSSVKAVKEA